VTNANVLDQRGIHHALDILGGFDEGVTQTVAEHIAGLESLCRRAAYVIRQLDTSQLPHPLVAEIHDTIPRESRRR
jgi:hypothetical protein